MSPVQIKVVMCKLICYPKPFISLHYKPSPMPFKWGCYRAPLLRWHWSVDAIEVKLSPLTLGLLQGLHYLSSSNQRESQKRRFFTQLGNELETACDLGSCQEPLWSHEGNQAEDKPEPQKKQPAAAKHSSRRADQTPFWKHDHLWI